MKFNYKDKVKNANTLANYMLAKTNSMFEYSGLPETLPAIELEKMLQKNGVAFIAKFEGDIFAFSGTMGGKQDAYGNYKDFIVSNPHLNYNATLEIGKDGILAINDSYKLGLFPLISMGTSQLAENIVNMTLWGYNSRTQKLISASDDRTKQSAEQYMQRIIDGDLSVIGENAMFEGVKLQTSANGSGLSIQQLIEYNQYIKSEMLNELGISSNFNMKRERLISSELDMAEDSLFSFVYNMMDERIKMVNSINEMFGLDVKVNFGSIWALKDKELVDGVVKEDVSNEQEREKRDIIDGDKLGVNKGVGEDHQKEIDHERERGRGLGDDSKTDPDLNVEKNELLEIINNPDSSEDDKKAAQELIDELKED